MTDKAMTNANPFEAAINVLEDKAIAYHNESDRVRQDGALSADFKSLEAGMDKAIAALREYPPLKAEVERLKHDCVVLGAWSHDYKARAEKAEDDLISAKLAIREHGRNEEAWSERCKKSKAELDAARPLLEAALGPCENRVTYAYRVNEAALAYRAKMEGKEKGQ